MVKNMDRRLRELDPVAKISHDVGSRNLGPTFLTIPVHSDNNNYLQLENTSLSHGIIVAIIIAIT